MPAMVVTRLVSHAPMSRLKSEAPKNMLAMLVTRLVITVQAKAHRGTVSPDKAKPDRNGKRVTRGAGCRLGNLLTKRQRHTAVICRALHLQPRGTGLAVPAMEGRHVTAVGICHRGDSDSRGIGTPLVGAQSSQRRERCGEEEEEQGAVRSCIVRLESW